MVQGLISLIVLVAGAWYFFGGGLDQQVARDMDQIERTVAADSVRQYGIVKRNGSPMEACVHAGLVTAAFLQAEDERSYRHWKQIGRS